MHSVNEGLTFSNKGNQRSRMQIVRFKLKNVALKNSHLVNALRPQKQISAEKSKRCPRVVYSLWRFCNITRIQISCFYFWVIFINTFCAFVRVTIGNIFGEPIYNLISTSGVS